MDAWVGQLRGKETHINDMRKSGFPELVFDLGSDLLRLRLWLPSLNLLNGTHAVMHVYAQERTDRSFASIERKRRFSLRNEVDMCSKWYCT